MECACLLWSPSIIQPGLIRDPESASAQPRGKYRITRILILVKNFANEQKI